MLFISVKDKDSFISLKKKESMNHIALTKAELNLKYKVDFKQLQELINSFDPISLIEAGAPEDEYDCLTEQILLYVYKKRTKIEMGKLVRDQIEHHFGLVVDEKYKEKFRTDIDEFIATIYDKFELNEKQNT